MPPDSSDPVKPLREALRFSPDNVPLRAHIAATLVSLGRFDEAEKEYREAIALAPADSSLKLGLANGYFGAGKTSHALVVLEEINKSSAASPQARVLLARVLLRTGDADRAAYYYRLGIEADASLADPALQEQLGVNVPQRESDIDQPERVFAGPDRTAPNVEMERPRVTFADVGGMEKVKEEIRLKIIYPLQRPELYKAYGKTIGGGILLYGPPGCGKTHLARATAGEVKAKFMAVGISDVLNMMLGESERNLHEIFEQARANTPCVLFFDEVDALGASRTDLRQSAGRQLVNQFLNELDGVSASNEGVLILAATNAPWHMDSAFRRPGRFDRIVFVPPPDEPARASILRIMLSGKPSESIDHAHLASKTDGYSGADLKAVVDVAIEGKLQDALSTGTPKPLTGKDLLHASKSVKPTAREWFSTAKNHALYANQAGLYDAVLEYLKIR